MKGASSGAKFQAKDYIRKTLKDPQKQSRQTREEGKRNQGKKVEGHNEAIKPQQATTAPQLSPKEGEKQRALQPVGAHTIPPQA